MSDSNGVSERLLRELVDAGAIRGVEVVAQGHRWFVQVRVGMERRPVVTIRHTVRWWSNLNRLARWMREDIGVTDWMMRAEDFAPGQRAVPGA